jgi:hypothetical protein
MTCTSKSHEVVIPLGQVLPNVLLKGSETNILGSMDSTAFLSISQLFHCSAEAALTIYLKMGTAEFQ